MAGGGSWQYVVRQYIRFLPAWDDVSKGGEPDFGIEQGRGGATGEGMSVPQVLAAARTMTMGAKSDTGLAVSSLAHRPSPCCRRRQHANATVSRILPTSTTANSHGTSWRVDSRPVTPSRGPPAYTPLPLPVTPLEAMI